MSATSRILVIASTPLQYLNAKEYVHQYAEGQSVDIRVISADKLNLQQLDKINPNTHEMIFRSFVRVPLKPRWVLMCLYIRALIKPEPYEKLIIGNLNNPIHYYLACRFYEAGKEVVLTDDGLATVNVWNARNQSGYYGFQGTNKFYKSLLYRFLGCPPERLLPRLTFFSVYKLDTAPGQQDRVLTQQQQKSLKPTNYAMAMFLGSPQVENGKMSNEVYVNLINSVAEAFQAKGVALTYVPHRLETSKALDCKQMSFSKPVELALVEDFDTIPLYYVSFYSTALINISRDFSNVKMFYIRLESYLKPQDWKQVEVAYQYFEQDPTFQEFNPNLITA